MKSEAEMLREALVEIADQRIPGDMDYVEGDLEARYMGCVNRARKALADPPAIAKETPLAPDGRIDLDKGVEQGVIEVHGLKPATPSAPKRWRCAQCGSHFDTTDAMTYEMDFHHWRTDGEGGYWCGPVVESGAGGGET